MEPASPRDAHSSTTRTPASASRASVPPHASDSSSGWAKTASTVRPARPVGSSGTRATVRLHDPFVHGDVFIHHPRDAKPLHRPLVDAPAVEGQHPTELIGH